MLFVSTWVVRFGLMLRCQSLSNHHLTAAGLSAQVIDRTEA
jgi:hypothetical protein